LKIGKRASFMKFTIKIIKDDDVLSLMNDDEFISSWSLLAKQDKKVTVIQEPPFVITWYKQYAAKYSPILCLGYDEHEKLVGLMPLAKRLDNGRISHAGDGHAEYHGWLSYNEIDETFPIKCVAAVKKAFNIKIWKWRWLPPGASVSWLFSKELNNENIYVKCKEQDSPLWDISDNEKLKKILKNKSIKTKINRYKKRGDYYLERIKDKERTRELINVLKTQCDFRQIAIHGNEPFADDTNKAGFFVERQDFPDSNHFVVLWVGEKPLAFHFGACDGKTAYLGLSSFDPVESKNSPGALLLIELAKMLLEEGYQYIDLTPGGDQYKDRFSTTYQKMFLPTFYFSRTDKLKTDIIEKLRTLSKKALIKLGMENPSQVRQILNSIKGIPGSLREITAGEMLAKVGKLIYEKHVCLYYCLKRDEFPELEESYTGVNVQNYKDILHYKDYGTQTPRRKFISEALRRFSNGETLYSIKREGSLVQCGWMAKIKDKFRDVDISFPKESVMLYDFYNDPKSQQQGLYEQKLKQMLSDSYKAGTKEVYIAVPYDNSASKAVVEKTGFSLFCTSQRSRFLWLTQHSKVI